MRALVKREAQQQKQREREGAERRAVQEAEQLVTEGRAAVRNGDWEGVQERVGRLQEAAQKAGTDTPLVLCLSYAAASGTGLGLSAYACLWYWRPTHFERRCPVLAEGDARY